MGKNILKLLKLFLFLIILLSSCQTNKECDTSTESLVKINFYIMNDGNEQAVIVQNISVYGLGREDSLLYDHVDTSYVLLPLSSVSDTSGFVLAIDAYKDTISFTYETKTYLESIECGFISNFDIDTVKYTPNIIDTLVLIENKVTIENENHVKIYFKQPSTDNSNYR